MSSTTAARLAARHTGKRALCHGPPSRTGRGRRNAACVVGFVLAACAPAPDAEPLPDAAEIRAAQESGADSGSVGPASAGALARGERLWARCVTCHQIGADARHAAGPHLNGIVGRPAGRIAGFNFSPSLAASDLVWTPAALDAWLADPWRFLPGSRMNYGGLSRADDRAALIAYLEHAGASAEP